LSVVDGSPTTKYAMNGGVHLAYQVLGAGSLDLVLVESWVHHVEAFWDVPELARQRRRLAAMGRPDLVRPAWNGSVGSRPPASHGTAKPQ
jgi:hypothetical protein